MKPISQALLAFVALSILTVATAAERLVTSRVIFASEAGAVLDSDLNKGGGTDDTAALQRMLDKAQDGRGVQLIVDGPALIGGLDLYSNTTIECTAGGGFYLKDRTRRAILRNAHRSATDVVDEHIAIRGCFINGNGAHQLTPDSQGPADLFQHTLQEPDGTYKSGLQFFGVHDLSVEHVTLWDTLTFGSWIANAKFVQIRDVIVDGNISPYPENADPPAIRAWLKQNRIGAEGDSVGGDDGLDFTGPIQYLTIDGVKLRTWDDGLSFMANNDCDQLKDEHYRAQCMQQRFPTPFAKGGAITDVIISNVIFMDAHHGIRLLSADDRVDRIAISNVAGTVRERFAVISHALPGLKGNFGSISFSNINVGLGHFPSWTELFWDRPKIKEEISAYEKALLASRTGFNSRPTTLIDGGEEAEMPLFSLNGKIETLSLNQVITSVVDRDRPVIRVGGDAVIQTMNLDLSIHDPEAIAVPLKLLGQIERLNFSLDWPGKNPILQRGGSVNKLKWYKK